MLRVLVWATTFGADLWSFARYLDRFDDIEVRVVMRGADTFSRQPVERLWPLRARRYERRAWHHLIGVPGFSPDVTVMDNWVPKRAPSKKGFMLWHGFGWRGPNDRVEFAPMHRHLTRAWGDPARPNPNFRWHCFGPSDFEHRTKVSGFAPENCRIVGAASHDDLRQPLDRGLVAAAYPFDVVRRKTVLFAPTWHYGEVFAHWGNDADLLDRLLGRVGELGANVILRLHDSFRFEPAYRATLDSIARRHRHVLLKFKDQDPDNVIDMQVSDVLVTNFSSIANLYYGTRRPTVHVYPVRSEDEAFGWRVWEGGELRTRHVESARYVWKFPPERNGGLLARTFDETLLQIERALEEPDCCKETCESFLNDYMLGGDGRNCERTLEALRELCSA